MPIYPILECPFGVLGIGILPMVFFRVYLHGKLRRSGKLVRIDFIGYTIFGVADPQLTLKDKRPSPNMTTSEPFVSITFNFRSKSSSNSRMMVWVVNNTAKVKYLVFWKVFDSLV